MDKNSSGTPLLIASLILGASVVAASLLIQASLDRATSQLAEVLVAISQARPAEVASTHPAAPPFNAGGQTHPLPQERLPALCLRERGDGGWW